MMVQMCDLGKFGLIKQMNNIIDFSFHASE